MPAAASPHLQRRAQLLFRRLLPKLCPPPPIRNPPSGSPCHVSSLEAADDPAAHWQLPPLAIGGQAVTGFPLLF